MATSKQIKDLNKKTTHATNAYFLIQEQTGSNDTHAILSQDLFTRAMETGFGTLSTGTISSQQLRISQDVDTFLDVTVASTGLVTLEPNVASSDETAAGITIKPAAAAGNTAGFFQVQKDDGTVALSVDNNNGRVGVAKSAPGVALDVAGSALVTPAADAYAFGTVVPSGTGIGLNIVNNGTGDSIQVDTTAFIVDGVGFVGMGIDPANPLSVFNTSNPQVRISYDAAGYATLGVVDGGALTIATYQTNAGISLTTGTNGDVAITATGSGSTTLTSGDNTTVTAVDDVSITAGNAILIDSTGVGGTGSLDLVSDGHMTLTTDQNNYNIKLESAGEIILNADSAVEEIGVRISADSLAGDQGKGVYLTSDSSSNTAWRLAEFEATNDAADSCTILFLQTQGSGNGYLVEAYQGINRRFTVDDTGNIDTDGGITVGGSNIVEVNGTIRYSGSDFEGYKAGTWTSLTTGGTGLVNAGDQYKVAYYPDTDGSTAVDDTSALYWKNDRLGVNEGDPQTDIHLKSATGPTIRLEHQGGAIEDASKLGTIEFYGYDDGPTDLEGVGAKIVGEASGGWSHDTNEYDTQAELQFWTTPGGDTEGLTRRLTIKDSGVIKYEKATHTNFPSLSFAATLDINLDTSNLHRITLTDDITFTFSNSKVGQRFIVRVLQDGDGNHTIAWPSGISWASGGTAPTHTATANRATVLGFLTTGSGTYDGFLIGKDIV